MLKKLVRNERWTRDARWFEAENRILIQ